MSDQMHRLAESLQPAREQRGHLRERRNEKRKPGETDVAAEADQVHRRDGVPLFECLDVSRPPTRRSAQPVQQRDRRARTAARLEQRMRRKIEMLVALS